MHCYDLVLNLDQLSGTLNPIQLGFTDKIEKVQRPRRFLRTIVNKAILIALLNVAYKIFTSCILSRMKETSENVIGEYRGGFRPGRSTTDQIFIVRQLLQKTWEFNKEMHIFFVNFQKAYDSLHRENLISTLAEFHFPHKLINLIKSSIMETYVKVRVGNIKSEQVQVRTGLRQGDSLSPILFNVTLEKVVREMNMGQHEGVNL